MDGRHPPTIAAARQPTRSLPGATRERPNADSNENGSRSLAAAVNLVNAAFGRYCFLLELALAPGSARAIVK